jgi:hypothetical protein
MSLNNTATGNFTVTADMCRLTNQRMVANTSRAFDNGVVVNSGMFNYSHIITDNGITADNTMIA